MNKKLLSIFILTIVFFLIPFSFVKAEETCDWLFTHRLEQNTIYRQGTASVKWELVSVASCEALNGKISDEALCKEPKPETKTHDPNSWLSNDDKEILEEKVVCCCKKPTTSMIKGTTRWVNPFDNLQVKIPGLKRFSQPKCYIGENGKTICENTWIGEYIKGIYNYAIGIVGILAVLALSIGGVVWLTSGGNTNTITKAKTWITGGITGLILTLASFTLLKIVNPELTSFKPLKTQLLTTVKDCPPKPKNCAKDALYCVPCKNCIDITNLGIEVKDGQGVNEAVGEKLRNAYENMDNKNWRITESWPPVICHESSCHANGTCVDIALTPPSNTVDCEEVNNLINDLENFGFNVLNEYTQCDGTETEKTTGGHLHISL